MSGCRFHVNEFRFCMLNKQFPTNAATQSVDIQAGNLQYADGKSNYSKAASTERNARTKGIIKQTQCSSKNPLVGYTDRRSPAERCQLTILIPGTLKKKLLNRL